MTGGVFDPELLAKPYGPEASDLWAKARLRDRIDAIIAHELEEAAGLSHRSAIERAENTPLAVTEGARRILRAHGRSGEEEMIHRLTLGHLDPIAIIRDRMVAVQEPLDMAIVHRLLAELGKVDTEGRWTLDDDAVTFTIGYLVIPWQGGWRNRIAEEFALRLHRDTDCVLADREHARVITPSSSKACARIPPVSRISSI